MRNAIKYSRLDSGRRDDYGCERSRARDDTRELFAGPPRSWIPGCHSVQRRHYVAVMAFFGFASIYAMRSNLTIALLDMTKNRTLTINGTVVHVSSGVRNDDKVERRVLQRIAEFSGWDSVTQGMVLGAFFYGYICTQLPGGWLARRYGGKLVYVSGVLGRCRRGRLSGTCIP